MGTASTTTASTAIHSARCNVASKPMMTASASQGTTRAAGTLRDDLYRDVQHSHHRDRREHRARHRSRWIANLTTRYQGRLHPEKCKEENGRSASHAADRWRRRPAQVGRLDRECSRDDE